MELQGIYILDQNPERYVRDLATDFLGTDRLDLSGVVFTRDADGVVIASGVVRQAA